MDEIISIGLSIIGIVVLLFLYFGVYKSKGAHDLSTFVMLIPALIGVVIGLALIMFGIVEKLLTMKIAIIIFGTVTSIILAILTVKVLKNWRKVKKNANRGN